MSSTRGTKRVAVDPCVEPLSPEVVVNSAAVVPPSRFTGLVVPLAEAAVIASPRVLIQLLASSEPYPEEEPALYRVPKSFTITHDSSGRIARVTKPFQLYGASLGRYLISHYAKLIKAKAIVKCEASHLVVRDYDHVGEFISFTNKVIRVPSEVTPAVDLLASEILGAILSLSHLTAATVHRLTVDAGFVLSNAASGPPTLPWIATMTHLFSEGSRHDVSLLSSGPSMAAFPPPAFDFLGGYLAELVRTCTLRDLCEHAHKLPVNARLRFLSSTLRVCLPLAVTDRAIYFRDENGGPLDIALAEDVGDELGVVVNTKPAAFNQLRSFADQNPRVYVIDKDATAIYQGGRGNRKCVEMKTTPITGLELKALRTALRAPDPTGSTSEPPSSPNECVVEVVIPPSAIFEM